MEFQTTPGTYASLDPFKPSISFSIKKILGSQRAPQDDTDLDSPPPRVAISTRRHGAIRPPANTAVDPREQLEQFEPGKRSSRKQHPNRTRMGAGAVMEV